MQSLKMPFLIMSQFGNSRFISMKLILSLNFKCQTEEKQVILRFWSCDVVKYEIYKLIFDTNCKKSVFAPEEKNEEIRGVRDSIFLRVTRYLILKY